MRIYKLIRDDLTQLGAMGSQPDSTESLFENHVKAREAAESDYGNTIKWKRSKVDGEWQLCSGDLSHVMYTIHGVDVV